MKYIFIIGIFFPIYLLFKLVFAVIIIAFMLISFLWNFSFKKAIDCFEWGFDAFLSGTSFNPIRAWNIFLDGLEDFADCLLRLIF